MNKSNLTISEGNKSLRSGSISYLNSNNVADSIGDIHNLFLDSLLQVDYPSDSVPIQDSVYSCVNSWVELRYDISEVVDLSILNGVSGYSGLFIDIEPNDYAGIYPKISGLSQQEADVIIDFFDVFLSNSYQTMSLEELKEAIIEVEDDFIINEGVNFEEFYFVTSVFRHSALYHKDAGGNDIEIVTGIPRWLWIALADALGAGIGGASSSQDALGALQGAAAASTLAHLWTSL